jgi:hypothetical protein
MVDYLIDHPTNTTIMAVTFAPAAATV